MIARSDRVVSHTDEGLGDEVRVTAAVRFDSPDDAVSSLDTGIIRDAKAKPLVLIHELAALL